MSYTPAFTCDETFDYIPTVGDIPLEPITVSWNLFGEDIDITHIEFGKEVWTGEELWELDDDLAENIMEYIDVEFISNDDFWFDKSNPGL
jgi:hypothetical protein